MISPQRHKEHKETRTYFYLCVLCVFVVNSYHAVQSLRWRDEGILSILRYLVTVRRATG
jgi:hypothetical protein